MRVTRKPAAVRARRISSPSVWCTMAMTNFIILKFLVGVHLEGEDGGSTDIDRRSRWQGRVARAQGPVGKPHAAARGTLECANGSGLATAGETDQERGVAAVEETAGA